MSSAFLDASFSSYTNFFSGNDYAFTYCIGETVLNYYLEKVSYKPKEVRVSYGKIMINNNNKNNNNFFLKNYKNNFIHRFKKNRLFTEFENMNIKIYTLCTFFLCTKENCRKMTI